MVTFTALVFDTFMYCFLVAVDVHPYTHSSQNEKKQQTAYAAKEWFGSYQPVITNIIVSLLKLSEHHVSFYRPFHRKLTIDLILYIYFS